MSWSGQELGGDAVEVPHSMDLGAWPKEEIQKDLEFLHWGPGVKKGSFHSGNAPLRVADFSLLTPSPLFEEVSEVHCLQPAPF